MSHDGPMGQDANTHQQLLPLAQRSREPRLTGPQMAEHARQILRTTFGYNSFRPLQGEVVQAILDRQDVFVLMPTGAGKSLCYQLPALMSDGVTVVVSPLIALMKDQVDALQALGVAATFINSSLPPNEIGRRQAAVARGEVKLVYVAPERLAQPGFLRLLQASEVAAFVVDEAHCISEWGHDFRPEYRQLQQVRQEFPDVPFGAFTATATGRVQADIIDQLSLQDAARFRGSFNRANLYYEVRPKSQTAAQLNAFLRQHAGASGIIYCLARAETERLAAALREQGFNAVAYHAGLTPEERSLRQEAFTRDDVHIVVATIAFGMGIDKPDVRFVVHHDLPKSLEGYYQESGRAGRDGDPSTCLLFYNPFDVQKYEHFINEIESEPVRAAARLQLRQMQEWAETETCRRQQLLAYFDEPFAGQPAPCCDLCSTDRVEIDSTALAVMFLSCVALTGERFGMTYIVDILRGAFDERIQRLHHDTLATYGVGRTHSKEEWLDLARQLIRRGYLVREGEYGVLRFTTKGREVLHDKDAVVGLAAPQKPAPRSSPRAGATNAPDPLFDRLRALRKRLADEIGAPPYVIFHDRVLREIIATRPQREIDLLQISGIGARKAAEFGAIFLDEIKAFEEEHP